MDERNDSPVLGRWVDRLGAALVAPALAMRASDTPEGQGRASSDIALLLLFAVLAVETELVVTAGWMILDGEWADSLTVILVGARQRLAVPIVLLLAGSVLLSLAAGRRRRPSDDFDLGCVALTPLVVLELANALLYSLFDFDGHLLGIYVGYAWFAFLLILAWRQTRSRSLAT